MSKAEHVIIARVGHRHFKIQTAKDAQMLMEVFQRSVELDHEYNTGQGDQAYWPISSRTRESIEINLQPGQWLYAKEPDWSIEKRNRKTQ